MHTVIAEQKGHSAFPLRHTCCALKPEKNKYLQHSKETVSRRFISVWENPKLPPLRHSQGPEEGFQKLPN